jgi:hypothetical protein
MASHFVSISRGIDGNTQSDFTTGIASSGQVFELRIDDASGARPTDIKLMLKSFERFFENPAYWNPAGFVVNG